MNIKGKSFRSFAAGMALFLAACGLAEAPKHKTIVTVGSRSVTADELKKDLRRLTFDLELTEHEMQTLLEPLVERLVDQYLILEYGRQEGIEVSDQELDRVVREIRKDYSEKEFEETLLRGVIRFEDWKEALREQLLLRKIMNDVVELMEHVPFQEIRDYYETHREAFRRPAAVRFRQIVTSSREEAEKALQRVNAGEGMNVVIEGYNRAGGTEYGGEVDWVTRGDLDESVEKVIFSLPPGKLSPVVETPYGFHLFEVLEKRAAGAKNFAEAIPEIEARLNRERQESFIRQWVENLRVVIPVQVDREMLKELELG